jgi:hypothetical protein
MRGEGLCIETIAARIGLAKTTYMDCSRRQPELAEALKVGMAKEHDRLVASLYRAAYGGFAPAAMFLLKCRHGYRENDVAAAPTSNVIIHLPSAMTIEDLKLLKEQGLSPLQLPSSLPEDEPELVDAEGEEVQ